VNSIILKFKKRGQTETLPGSSRPKKIDEKNARKLARDMDKNSMQAAGDQKKSLEPSGPTIHINTHWKSLGAW
jgi:hypothetical protein